MSRANASPARRKKERLDNIQRKEEGKARRPLPTLLSWESSVYGTKGRKARNGFFFCRHKEKRKKGVRRQPLQLKHAPPPERGGTVLGISIRVRGREDEAAIDNGVTRFASR